MRIEPNDMIQRENIEQHKLMVEAINFNNDLFQVMVRSVNTKTGDVILNFSDVHAMPDTMTKADIELGNVDNTSDLNKPISNAIQTALTNINNQMNGLLNLVAITATSTSVTLRLTYKDGTYYDFTMPLASSTGAGFAPASFYSSVVNAIARITALESAIRYGPVPFPNASPSQVELDGLYENLRISYPSLPVTPTDGFRLRDSSIPQLTSLEAMYSVIGDTLGNHWIWSSGTPGATSTTPGIVKGVEDLPENYGRGFVEADLTISFLGYDLILTRLSNLETALTALTSKVNGLTVGALNVPITVWSTNTDQPLLYDKGYIYKSDIYVTGMLETMKTKIEIDLVTYLSGNLWDRYVAYNGFVRIYSKVNTNMTANSVVGMKFEVT